MRKRELIVIKPSGVSYEDMTVHDLVVIDLEGNIVDVKALSSLTNK